MASNPFLPPEMDDERPLPTSEAAGVRPGAVLPPPASPAVAAQPISFTAGNPFLPPDMDAPAPPAPGYGNFQTADPVGTPRPVVREDLRPDLEALPDLMGGEQGNLLGAPAIRTARGALAAFTNTGADEIAELLKTEIPGTEVESVDGYRIYKFPGDPQKYAYKPGARTSDFMRATPAVLAGIGAGLAAPTVLPAIGLGGLLTAPAAGAAAGTAGTVGPVASAAISATGAVLQELMQGAAGGSVDKLPVAISAVAPFLAPAARGTAGAVANLAERMTAPAGQTVESVAPRLVDRIKQVLTGYGADPDASGLAQRVASLTGPAAEQAETVATRTAAQAEADVAAAAAQAKTGTRAATRAAQDAKEAVVTGAEDAATRVRRDLEDKTAAASAEAAKKTAAAGAPVEDFIARAQRSVDEWSDVSTLDRQFMERQREIIGKAMHQADVMADDVVKGFPATTRIEPDKPLRDAVEWIEKELAGTAEEKQDPMLKQALRLILSDDEPLQLGTLTKMRQDASAAGRMGSTFATSQKGTGKKLAGYLTAIEMDTAEKLGMGEKVAAFRKVVSDRKVYEGKLEEALGKRGEKALTSTIIPAIDRAGEEARRGNSKRIMDILATTPEDMQERVTATILQRTLLNNAPGDPAKAAQFFADAVDNLMREKVVAGRIFSKLPGAKKTLLDMGADAKRILREKAAAEGAAEAEKDAAMKLAKRTADDELMAIDRAKRAGVRDVGRDKTDAAAAIGRDKADAVAAARNREAAAKAALEQAKAADIALVPELKTAGRELATGNMRPMQDLLKKAPPGTDQGELVASAIYHQVVDPTDKGLEAVTRAADYFTRLDANPTARNMALSKLPPGVDELADAAELARRIAPATQAGTEKLGKFMGALVSMGAWASGKTGAVLGSALGGTVAGPRGAAVGLPLGYFGARIVQSMLSRSASAETRAANAFLASPAGRDLLTRLALDQPVSQGMIRSVAHGSFKRLAAALGIPPSQRERWLEQAVRRGAVQGATPNNTKEEE